MRNAILSIAVLLIACTLRAQEGASVTAAQHQNQAAMLLLNSEPAEAISSLQAAAALYKRDADWEHYFSCLNQVTEAYLELGRLEDAKRWAKKALWESIEKLGRDNNEAARAAHKLGEAYSSAGRHESALESHRLGLMIRRKLYGGRHPELADSYDWIARAYAAMGMYDKAEDYFQRSRSLRESVLGSEHAEVAVSYYLLGDLAAMQQQTEKALKYHRRALAIRRKSLGASHPDVANSLLRLGALSAGTGEKEAAAELYSEAVSIWVKGGQVRREPVAEACQFLAACALEKGQPEEAVQWARLSPGMQAASGGAFSSLYSLGFAFLQQGAPQEGAAYLEEALGKEKKQSPASCYHLLAESYRKAGQPQKAAARSEDYLQWASRQDGQLLALADANLQLGYSLLGLGEVREAAHYLEKGLGLATAPVSWRQAASLALGEAYRQQRDEAAALAAFRVAARSDGSPFYRFLALQALAEAHSALAAQDRNTLENLKAALRISSTADSLVWELLRRPLSVNQLRQIQARQGRLYERAIGACFSLNLQSPLPAYGQQAFYFAERSKQLDVALPLLMQAGITYLGVPASLLLEEAECRRQLSSLEYQEELLPLEQEAVGKVQAEADSWTARYNDVMQALQHEAPQYYRLKYTYQAVELEPLQAVLLGSNTLLYAYYSGQEHLYIFIADGSSGLLLFRQPLKGSLAENLVRFSSQQTVLPRQNLKDGPAAGFSTLGLSLYSRLFPVQPSAGKDGEMPQLCILPHGQLELFPFESLLTEETGALQFSELPYLGRRCAITYNYTASALLETAYMQAAASPGPFQAFVFQGGALQTAPSDSYSAESGPNNNGRLQFFSALAALWTAGGKAWEGGSSGEAAYRHLPGSGALLMATPAIMAPNPLDAFLELSPTPDSLYDNLLKVNELYELKAPASLLVFSSLEMPAEGPPVRSTWPQLAQALAYSGCGSLILHRWDSPGPPSENMLQFFLDAYQPGITIPEALLAARQAYLQRKDGPERAHPYYWAGYMQIGAPRPIRGHLPIPSYLILAAVGLLILIGWWSRR